MKAGRPTGSPIRKNIIALLSRLGKAYGYEIYKEYVKEYPAVSLRIIYYHLKKGVELKEIRLIAIKKHKGKYSWGTESERILYGPAKR